MFNKLKTSAKNGATHKFIKTMMMVGTTLLITLNAGAKPASAEVQREIAKVFKQNPDKEIIVKMNQKINERDEKTYDMSKQGQLDSIPPDTTTIKNFFLEGGFLTPEEVIDFNNMRKESTNSPSRPATYLTICDIRKIAKSDYNKAIYTTSFLDPFQKTTLGKSAFKAIDTEKELKGSYNILCKIHTGNIETIKIEAEKKQLEVKEKQLDEENKKLDEENKKLDEEIKKLKTTLQLLQQIENVYDTYLNK